MPDPMPAARRRLRHVSSALVLIGLALAPAPALAWPEDEGYAPPRSRRAVRMRAEPMAGPPPALVSGYLPRNHNVPMYNEPPRGRSAAGPAW